MEVSNVNGRYNRLDRHHLHDSRKFDKYLQTYLVLASLDIRRWPSMSPGIPTRNLEYSCTTINVHAIEFVGMDTMEER